MKENSGPCYEHTVDSYENKGIIFLKHTRKVGPGTPNYSVDPGPPKVVLGLQNVEVGPGTPYLILLEIVLTFLSQTHQ